MIDARNINDLAARIKQLGMGIQSGQIEGTAQNVMHLMHLKDELQKAKAMQNSAMANAPKPPTVMDQVASSAVQDADQAQAQSVQDLMKQRAMAMQGEMAGTGGIGDFVKEPEKKMALGGAVAFYEGRKVPEPDPRYSERDPEMLNRFWTYENSPEYEEYKRKYGLKGVLEKAGSNIGEGASNLYQNAKGLVAATPEIYAAKAKEYAAEDAADTRKMLDAINWYGTENQPQPTQPAPAPQAAQPQPTQVPAPLAPMTGAGSQVLNTAAQSDNRDMASRMQLGAPQTGNVQTKYGTTVPAGGIAQNPAVQQEPAQEPAQERKSLADYIKEHKDLAGPNQSLEDLRSELNKQKEETANRKDKSLGMALMQAGFGAMAGTSPFAMANIGQGAMKGLEAYTETQKDLEKAKDRQFDLQAKIGAAQRAEDLAALNYGTDSVKFDKAEASKERLQDKHDETLKDIAKMNNQADIQRANINASAYGVGGKGSDEQHTVTDLLKAMEDPKAYPQLRGANGAPDILKVRQAASIASGTNKQTPVVSNAETNKLYAEWQKDNINRAIYKLPQRSFNEYIGSHPNAAHMLTSQDQDINTLVSRYSQ